MNELTRRHRAITACHGWTGLLTAVWGAGLAATDSRLQLGPGRLGAALMALAVAALVAMPLVGRVVERKGSARVLRVALPGAAAALAVTSVMPTADLLIVGAALFGAACGALNVALTAEALAVEVAMSRPVVARMHGFWTLGAAGGGAGVAAALQTGVDSRIVLAGGACLTLVAALATVGGPTGRAAAVPERHRRAGPGPRRTGTHLVALGALGAAAFVAEGAATDWSGVHATRVLGASPAVAAAIYTLFFLAMTVARFGGDRVRARFGAARTVRGCGLVATAGYAVVLAAGAIGSSAVGVAIIGWILVGVGVAVMWPVVISTLGAAGADGGRLAVVTSIGYGGGAFGPALIGAVASLTSLPTALLIPAALAALVAGTAPAILRRYLRAATSTPEPITARSNA